MKLGRSSCSCKEKTAISSVHFPFFDTPKPPIQAMEFLSRPWSPSSSDFLQILSSPSPSSSSLSDMLLQTSDEEGEWTVSAGKSRRAKRKSMVRMKGFNLDLKTWLGIGGGDLTSEFSRASRKQKRGRRHAASMQASALSVTHLAAAVAGVMGNLGLLDESCWNMQMSQAVASASALVATVCAETAESAGVDRIQISSAMNMGGFHIPLSSSPSAPTKPSCSTEQQEMLARGTQLLVISSSGKVHKMEVSVYIKHHIRLVLKLGKKLLLGAITTHREHEIVQMNDEEDLIRDGGFVMSVGTATGTFNILFDNQTQCNAWKSAISRFLFSLTLDSSYIFRK